MRRWLLTKLPMIAVACAILASNVALADGELNAALGQPTKPDAIERLSKGNGFYKIGEFDQAIEQYKAGSLIESAGVFQFNLGQAYRQQGNYERAIWHYQRFLAMRDPTGELREMIEGFVATMKAELDKAASKQEPTEPGAAPTTQTRVEVDEPIETSRPSSWTTRRKIAVGVATTGLVALGAGVAFGLRAKGFEDDAEELCPEVQCADAAESNGLLNRGADNATYANIAYGVGAAAVVGAVVLWLTGAPSASESTRTAVMPIITPHLTGAAFSASF